MAKSTRRFARWTAHDKTTWPFQIFQKYNDELHRILNTHLTSQAHLYSYLKGAGAKWEDHPDNFFTSKGRDFELYKDLRQWSDWYNLFDNWVTLSRIMSIASTVETYLASVITLSLESDPGLLLGVSRAIDGAAVLKRRVRSGFDASEQIESCTKGDWSSRLDSFEKLFGACPPELRAAHSSLETIRTTRNRFGHAFGRDIEKARLYGVLEILPIERLSRTRANKLWKDTFLAMKAVDLFFLETHIGDFEIVHLYQSLHSKLHSNKTDGEQASQLKKMIGNLGASSRGKLYCRDLMQYWETL